MSEHTTPPPWPHEDHTPPPPTTIRARGNQQRHTRHMTIIVAVVAAVIALGAGATALAMTLNRSDNGGEPNPLRSATVSPTTSTAPRPSPTMSPAPRPSPTTSPTSSPSTVRPATKVCPTLPQQWRDLFGTTKIPEGQYLLASNAKGEILVSRNKGMAISPRGGDLLLYADDTFTNPAVVATAERSIDEAVFVDDHIAWVADGVQGGGGSVYIVPRSNPAQVTKLGRAQNKLASWKGKLVWPSFNYGDEPDPLLVHDTATGKTTTLLSAQQLSASFAGETALVTGKTGISGTNKGKALPRRILRWTTGETLQMPQPPEGSTLPESHDGEFFYVDNGTLWRWKPGGTPQKVATPEPVSSVIQASSGFVWLYSVPQVEGQDGTDYVLDLTTGASLKLPAIVDEGVPTDDPDAIRRATWTWRGTYTDSGHHIAAMPRIRC